MNASRIVFPTEGRARSMCDGCEHETGPVGTFRFGRVKPRNKRQSAKRPFGVGELSQKSQKPDERNARIWMYGLGGKGQTCNCMTTVSKSK